MLCPMKTKPQPDGRSPAPKEPWHAVSIVAGVTACPAAAQAKGKRFLATDAPRIPLQDCAWAWRCKCVYRHHPDRRAAPRRIADRGMMGRHKGSERRQSRGRRGDDTGT